MSDKNQIPALAPTVMASGKVLSSPPSRNNSLDHNMPWGAILHSTKRPALAAVVEMAA